MIVKIPKDIRVGAHRYRVEYNSLLWHEEGLKGCANHLKQFIQIDPVLAPSQKLVTLFHEINHIINNVYSCKLDEDEINKMAEGWADLLMYLGIEFDWSLIKEKKS